MDIADELARFNPDPALAEWVLAQLAEQAKVAQQAQDHADEVAQQHRLLQAKDQELHVKNQELRNKDLKIQALTLELAHHRRIRFGVKSEALAPEQRDLFDDTCAE
ncbi:IS66 family transposase, partial [Parachitinimonas caeni]|nr:hypothetical protein [Parachitinimonas caeni]